ncbi:DUF2786 domain-containing protein [Falsiroseomonas tokyonensis]|uniref:DUF2786 domain-containing protein n=1 Tax=Falsiroseomonas tokyonensis TaxID=430521 RepID=A0ABV7BU54_9PROT|nr:DUF2786 domain-containing protein [Falsiroseomonas tokyonensis]MBU8539179.1 DUF2786 domain-containing protein [Falsiroseomonas tokyonensis]
MTQRTELEKVKGRIRALAAKTIDRGCSEAEAMIAAQKVGELLEVYGLSMSEVELREEACIQRSVTITGPRLQAVTIIFMAIIRLTETRGWMNGRNEMVLFGLEPDVLMGEYLLHLVAGAVDHEEQVFRASAAFQRSRQTTQQRLRSFRYGFAERVSDRLEELAQHRQAAEAAARSPGSTGTALVVAKEKRIAEAFRDLGIRLRSRSTTRRVSDSAAYRQGQEAGRRVSLERPVGAGAGRGLLPK